MNKMRIRPKSDYLQTASWENIYVLSEHWQSDLYFFRDEIRFLDTLFSKYFIWMTKEENISKIQNLVTQLEGLKKKNEELSNQLNTQFSHITLLMENAFSHDDQKFRDEHEKLEENITKFFKDFRALKKEVFEIMEHVLESEKLKHLST